MGRPLGTYWARPDWPVSVNPELRASWMVATAGYSSVHVGTNVAFVLVAMTSGTTPEWCYAIGATC
jgi:hypothetical protein